MSDSWKWPGARWWKFDFHTHTPASVDYGKGPDQCQLRRITPKEWLLGFMRAEVDCVAVTDHNTGEWIDRLKAALRELEHEEHPEFRPVHLFPGVEVTANGSIHILAVFDTDKGSSDVEALLGAVGFHGERGASDIAADSASISVVKAIVETGAIPILAHVDGPSGAWGLPGNTLGPLLDSDGLFTIQVIDSSSPKPELYRQRNPMWAEVLGSDSHHPSDGHRTSYPGSHYTWVKMAKPSLEGLRLALLDGGAFSIRRSDEPEPFDPFGLPEHFIEEVQIENARYMGHGQPANLTFNPWLNALVGGRGTGKSTVIHALRLAARREWKSGDSEASSGARTTFEGFNQVPADRTREGGLLTATRIRLTVMRDGIRHRVHWRQTGDGTVVEEHSDDDGWKPSSAQTVTPDRFPLRIFSQGQIAELAGENQQALLGVIDQAAGVTSFNEDLATARNSYYVTKAGVRELDSRLKRRDDLTVKLQDVERNLNRFEEAGHAATLITYRRRNRQRRETDRQFETVQEAVRRIESAADDLHPEDLPDELFDDSSEEDKYVVEVVAALGAAIHAAGQSLREAAQSLREMAQTQHTALTRSAWQAAVDAAVADYENLVEELRAEGETGPSEYSRLVQERQRLDAEVQHLESEKEESGRLEKLSQEQLKVVLETRRAVNDARNEFLSTVLAQNEFVRIETCPYGDDPQVIERSLREVLGVLDDRFERDILSTEEDGAATGCVANLLEDLPSDSKPRLTEFESRLESLKQRFESACAGNGDFRGQFNNYLKRQFERSPDFLDKLLTWFPEDGLRVEYSRGGDGRDFQPISQASAGQRSAAMLAFLLAHGNEPLILDQPEDDLDNHLIYDLVVRQIRENKLRRQIIVVTHNPNIVVNGDAEMLHALDFRNGQCIVAQSGSLQEKGMREEICRVMEGGREAFDRRYRRLGPE